MPYDVATADRDGDKSFTELPSLDFLPIVHEAGQVCKMSGERARLGQFGI